MKPFVRKRHHDDPPRTLTGTISNASEAPEAQGWQPKTIEAYSRAIRRIGKRFDHQIDSLTEGQLTNYFTELLASHSWSAVKLDLYGLKFYYQHVLRQPRVARGLIKAPKSQRLPDIFTIGEAQRIFAAMRPVFSATACSSSPSTV